MHIRLSFVFYSISVRSWIRIQVRGCLRKWLIELLLHRRVGKGLGVRELPKDSRLRILKVTAECKVTCSCFGYHDFLLSRQQELRGNKEKTCLSSVRCYATESLLTLRNSGKGFKIVYGFHVFIYL